MNAFRRLVGGANIFAAGLLVFLTFVSFGVMGMQRMYTPDPVTVLGISTSLFLVLAGFIWVKWGLVPNTTARGKGWLLFFGHILVASGTVAYGSVTFYMPVLIWLGLIQKEDGAVLPWLAFFTLPLACVLWTIGLILVVSSREVTLDGTSA